MENMRQRDKDIVKNNRQFKFASAELQITRVRLDEE
jgi:hypothetical protein